MSIIRLLQVDPSTSVAIEAVDVREPGAAFAGREGRLGERLADSIDDIADTVQAMCAPLRAKLADIKASELSFGFGLALTAQGGILVVSGNATANFSITMKFTA
jgi:hypothetical protein